jgi:3-methyladenine DNA glycosylase/8-oxoguanine DNA glycosylase
MDNHCKFLRHHRPMHLILNARQPFNFHSVVNSHGWIQLAPFRFDEGTQVLYYVDRLANSRVVQYCISRTPKGVDVEVAARLNKAEQNEIAQKVEWMFGLDQDFSAFYKAARPEPKLRRAEKLARGRVLRSPTFFEDVLKTILTTNTLWAATRRMNLNLIASFGEPLPASGAALDGLRAFPHPQKIAASTEALLRQTVRAGYRAPAILELAKRVTTGELDVEAFKTSALPTPELRRELMKIRGIGPYAAANLLMILGRSDFIPIDTYALKMVSHEWHQGRPITAREVEKAFTRWGEFKGLAFWFWDWKDDGG